MSLVVIALFALGGLVMLTKLWKRPGLADQFITYQDQREQEVKRQLAINKLDKMVLYEDTLKKIAECVPRPPADPAPVPPPPAPPNG